MSGTGRATSSLRLVLRTTLYDLANILLPSDCRTCGAPMLSSGKVRVCDVCLAGLDPTPGAQQELLCSRCGDALGMESARFGESLGITECTACRLAPPAFSRAVAFAAYDRELREMLHLLKFERRRTVAEHILGHRLASAILQLRPHTADALVVVPVPLFAARERSRGFNQASLLAAAAIRQLRRTDPAWSLKLNVRCLARVRDTHALYHLNPSQRRRSLQGAFRVLDRSAILGREVLLIDDILTTGATARECSRVLLAAGATRVWVATAARARPESAQATAFHEAGHSANVASWDVPAPRPPTVIQPDPAQRRSF